MAFISSKFNVPVYNGSGLTNAQAWADELLTKVKNAFIDANSAWALQSDIETIGTNTDTAYGLRTLQLKSDISGKYVRIWCFCGPFLQANFVDSETASGNYNAIKIYKGNVFKCNEGNSSNRCLFGGYYESELVFGVSSQSIGADFGLNLNLDVPMFSIVNSYSNMASSKNLSYASDHGLYNQGGTVTIMTDGTMFSVMRKFTSGSDTEDLRICLYSPDLMICANPGDSNTEGVISCIGINNFYLGNNEPYSAEAYISVLFNAADGTRDFSSMCLGIYNGKGALRASESCPKLLTTAIECHMYPYTYSGSTMTGVINGIGMKGWVNNNYIRSANIDHLPSSSRGLKYANGQWFCVDAGTLICWDDSNSSPFEAAT